MIIVDQELYHYGTPRRSGRYPWGSGDNPYQHELGWLGTVNKMKDSGMTDVEIARALGISTTVLRARRSAEKDAIRARQATEALRLKDKGYSNAKIGEILGAPGAPIGESTVRNLLKSTLIQRANATANVAEVLRDAVKKHTYIDVGSGVEAYLGVSKTKLNTAVQMLKDEGYDTMKLYVDQLGTGFKTELKVLVPPGTDYGDMIKNRDKISLPIGDYYFEDRGMTKLGIEPPVSVNPNRVAVRYAEDGGTERDGVIQIRRGVEDISLGDSAYAQVRIKVGDGYYLKGMAMYSDDLPKGVDLMFNTNKHKGTPMMGEGDDTVLKHLKDDPDNPFGASISKQRKYVGADGEMHLSAINIVNDEGSWADWKKTLSSQVLSKQPVPLAKKQLGLAYDEKKAEFDEIMSLTNPAVQKKLLESFADDCDSCASHLKAAALPRQQSHVILPFPGMKENEVYAPNYQDGETVVLIRHPHAGQFEIPVLTVNNNNKEAIKTLGKNPIDAIGINSKVAEQLSGADFDGDSVLVIPNKSGAIKASKPVRDLVDFNPSEYYPAYDGMPRVGPNTGFNKGQEMGKISNLITDMTIKGASQEEIVRAVKHSMVVIDAEKHNLNWRQSYDDNCISELQEKYQGKKGGGASTLISQASAEARVPQRKMRTDIDPETGKKIYFETGETYINKQGKEVPLTTKTTRMAKVEDAYELSSGTLMENAYADYANRMKALANEARKAYEAAPSQKYSPSAKKVYEKEVADLKAKLNTALKNAPLERQAQLYANLIVQAKKKANPSMDYDDLKKIKSQALAASRARVGANKKRVQITSKEWEAIQAGAISNNLLVRILNNTDLDVIRAYATPKSSGGLSTSDISRAKALIASGHTQAEVAAQLGISTTTLFNALKA